MFTGIPSRPGTSRSTATGVPRPSRRRRDPDAGSRRPSRPRCCHRCRCAPEERPCLELRRSPRWRGSAAARRAACAVDECCHRPASRAIRGAVTLRRRARGNGPPTRVSHPARTADAGSDVDRLHERADVELEVLLHIRPGNGQLPLNAANPGSVASSA